MEDKVFSSFDYFQLTSLFQVEDALKIVVENLQDILDLDIIIIAYYESDEKEVLTYISPDLSDNEQTTLSYLYSEKWYSNHIPEGTIILLEIPTVLITYGYIFPHRNQKLEYVLILTKTQLTQEQNIYFAQQLQLINICLNMAQTCWQKNQQIEMLEETIQVCEHQLRHSLSSINLFAENLYLGLYNHPLQEQTDLIKKSSAHIQKYLDKKLSEINRYKPQLQSENIREIIVQSWQQISCLYQEKKLQLKLNSEGVLVFVDAWQIKQVIDNILGNAIHFSPVGETITCQWYLLPREVLIEIIDLGLGFSSEALESAFSPYFSQRKGGKGLGLAIAKKIIQVHQGKIWLENLPSQGAKVCFTLPRYLV